MIEREALRGPGGRHSSDLQRSCSVPAQRRSMAVSHWPPVRVHFRTTPLCRLDAWLRRIDRWIAYANSIVEE
jgi:hypothetical protein